VPNTIIVVDMQKGFMATGGTLYCGDEAHRIMKKVLGAKIIP